MGRLMVNLFYVSHADHRIPSAPKWNALADPELQQPKLPVPVEREVVLSNHCVHYNTIIKILQSLNFCLIFVRDTLHKTSFSRFWLIFWLRLYLSSDDR